MSMPRRQSSSVISGSGLPKVPSPPPALLIRMSILPNSLRAAATSALTCAESPTSVGTIRHLRPVALDGVGRFVELGDGARGGDDIGATSVRTSPPSRGRDRVRRR